MELGRPQGRAPLPELIHPVVQCRLRHYHQMGTADASELIQVAEQRDGLQGLAQTLDTCGWTQNANLESYHLSGIISSLKTQSRVIPNDWQMAEAFKKAKTFSTKLYHIREDTAC